jgi:hypothetical protein
MHEVGEEVQGRKEYDRARFERNDMEARHIGNKIAKASSKYAKITLLANLLLVLSRAFLP